MMTTGRISPRSQLRFGFVSLIMVMLGLMALMSVVSLTSLTSQATMGYEIERLEAEKEELVSDMEINDMLILEARSLDMITESAVVADMVRVDSNEIAYIEPVVTVASSAY